MYLKRYYDEEIWKQVELKSPFIEKYELWVSNYGNIKRITLATGLVKILSQHPTEGYPSVNISLLLPISEKENIYYNEIRKNISTLETEIKTIKKEIDSCDGMNATYYDLSKRLEETLNLHNTIKTSYKKKYKKDEQKRKQTYGSLVHRFVSIYFVDKPTIDHNLVAHIDYDKLNNHHSNLKWMTREENTLHQKNSPIVIESKAKVLSNGGHRSNSKLTVSQVMLIKKRINEEVPLRKLAKLYKITETQLLRIKRGINWGKIPAAR